MKELPITNKHLFHNEDASPLSRGKVSRYLSPTKKESLYIGMIPTDKQHIVTMGLVHNILDNVDSITGEIVEGIQILLIRDVEYNFKI